MMNSCSGEMDRIGARKKQGVQEVGGRQLSLVGTKMAEKGRDLRSEKTSNVMLIFTTIRNSSKVLHQLLKVMKDKVKASSSGWSAKGE